MFIRDNDGLEWIPPQGGGRSGAAGMSRRYRYHGVSPIATFLVCVMFVAVEAVDTSESSMDNGTTKKSILLDPWSTIFGPGTGNEHNDNALLTPRVSDNSNVLLDLFSQWNSFSQNLASTKTGVDEISREKPSQNSNQDDLLAELLESMSSRHPQQATHATGVTQKQLSLPELIELFWNTTQQIQKQLNATFNNVLELTMPNLNPIQLYYYMLEEELKYNPVHKRRQHAFMKEISESMALQLADGLYLSQLAYVNDCALIVEHLRSFQNNTWVVLNCTTESKPQQPAHFLTVRRVSKSPLQWNYSSDSDSIDGSLSSWWEGLRQTLNFSNSENPINSLEAVLVVRGTKDMSDMMSDALLEPVNYGTDGKAHDGIYRSSLWLHDMYRPFLEQLVQQTKRSKLKLWLVGHSLGAGAAALACLEFNKPSQIPSISNATWVNSIGEKNGDGVVPVSNIEAYALGFGTPAVLSKQLSEEARSKVTTVVNDADCVPRMSGATLMNMVLSMASSDHWKTEAHIDFDILSSFLTSKSPFPSLTEKILNGIKNWIVISDEDKNTTLKETLAEKFVPPVLFPPGECIHLYRDGTGWRMVYYPCSNFTAIEGVPYMVDDHLIPTGYYRGLLEYIRAVKDDLNWRFDTDLMDLPV
jgi:Lipase (class 3)